MGDLREHPVGRLLLERAAAGSLPGAREDPYVLAVAIEGGGMRGVASAGMVAALEGLGLADAADMVFGVSAGASNAVGLVSRRGLRTPMTYVHECTDGIFIDLRRALRRQGPIMDLPHLVDDIVLGAGPVGVDRVLRSPVLLGCLATDLATGEAVVLDRFTGREDLRAALLASSAMPGVGAAPVLAGGRLCVDGTIAESIPFQAAVRAGATHVLALQTRPEGDVQRPPSIGERVVVPRAMRRMSPALAERYTTRPGRYAAEVEELAARTADAGGPPYLAAIRPAAGTRTVGHLEQRVPRLLAGAASGVRAVHHALAGRELWVDGRLRVLDGAGATRR